MCQSRLHSGVWPNEAMANVFGAQLYDIGEPWGATSDGNKRVLNQTVCETCLHLRKCSQCHQPKAEDDYSTPQWGNGARRICKSCADGKGISRKRRGFWTCGNTFCKAVKPHEEFSKCQLGTPAWCSPSPSPSQSRMSLDCARCA